MPVSIRDLALERDANALPELIDVCKRPGSVYGHDNALAAAVTRKAKSLQTLLAKLREALGDAHHQPAREESPIQKEPLELRLYFQHVMYEIARAVNYGGKRPGDLKEKLDELASPYSNGKVALAFSEQTMEDNSRAWASGPRTVPEGHCNTWAASSLVLPWR
jgi:hypothetical protein